MKTAWYIRRVRIGQGYNNMFFLNFVKTKVIDNILSFTRAKR